MPINHTMGPMPVLEGSNLLNAPPADVTFRVENVTPGGHPVIPDLSSLQEWVDSVGRHTAGRADLFPFGYLCAFRTGPSWFLHRRSFSRPGVGGSRRG